MRILSVKFQSIEKRNMYMRGRAHFLIFLNISLTRQSALKSMKSERISSNIRNVRAHDLRSNDLRTKNIIILRASWRGNQKERWKKAVFFDSGAPYASAAWLFFNGSWLHIPIRIATSPKLSSLTVYVTMNCTLNAKENKLGQIESWS